MAWVFAIVVSDGNYSQNMNLANSCLRSGRVTVWGSNRRSGFGRGDPITDIFRKGVYMRIEELRAEYGDTCRVCGNKAEGYHRLIIGMKPDSIRNYVPLCCKCHVLACSEYICRNKALGIGYESVADAIVAED